MLDGVAGNHSWLKVVLKLVMKLFFEGVGVAEELGSQSEE